MRRFVLFLAALVLLVGGSGWTDEPAKGPAPAAAKAQVDRLQAQLHRLMADLLDARAADKVDPAKVAGLNRQVQELKAEIQAVRKAAPAKAEVKAPAKDARAPAKDAKSAASTAPAGCPGCPGCCGNCAACPLGAGKPAAATQDARATDKAADKTADRAGPPMGRGPGMGMGRGPGMGMGRGGPGMGMGRGPGMDAAHAADMEVFHYLLRHHEEISRKVTKLPEGVLTVTESDKPDIAAKIQEHAEAMHRRVKEGRPIHMRDPLFREVFVNADKIDMAVEKTAKGVKVKETSKDAYVARLIQAHAEVVNQFVANGIAEMPKNHAVPARE